MQRRMMFAAACGLAIGLLGGTRTAAAQGQGEGAEATYTQLRVCRSEADRRLPDYSYDQIQVASESRDQNVASVRWTAGSQSGTCTVATNGRLLGFTRDTGSPMENVANRGGTTRIACESRRGERQQCRIPAGARARLVRELGDSPCRLNSSYGQGQGYIWVSQGCRGEFEVVSVGTGGGVGGSMKVTCESSGTQRKQCPIPANARVRLINQLSSTACRVGDTYGSTEQYIWVQRGCRAVFEVSGWSGGTQGGTYTTRMTCESDNNQRKQCPIAGATQIRVIRQISSSPCKLNESYGLGFGHFWVDKGCRGEFELTVRSGANRPIADPLTGPTTGLPARITCESNAGERTECRVRNGAQVQLIRQISTAGCVRNSTWGTGDGVIWVTRGCRGEFEVK